MNSSPPKIPASLWLLAIVTGAGAFMAMLDSTVVNLALNTFENEFHASIEQVQWVVTIYLIALAVSLPMTGWLGRRFGQGRVWIISVIGFCLSSLICALAGSLSCLILARVVQGLMAGVMVPTGQAVLGSCADQRQLGRLMGTVGFAVALGPVLGPGLGGILIEYFSWRWVFGINVVIGLISLYLARDLVPRGEPLPSANIDKRGFFLASIGIPLLLFGAAEMTTAYSNLAVVATVFGMIFSAVFVWHALKIESPLIRIKLLSIPRLAAGTTTALFTGAAMYAGLLILPLYFISGLGISTSTTGFYLLIMGLGSAIALPLAGTLTDRFSPGLVSLAGCILLTIGTIPFLMPISQSVSVIILTLLSRGSGLALAQAPAMIAVYGAVDKENMGDAAVLVNIAQRLGGAFGAIAIVITLNQFALENSSKDFTFPIVLLSALAVVAFCSAFWLLKTKRK